MNLNNISVGDSSLGYLPNKQMITCAVVLFVKDEFHDIAAWLAWYHILGFDTCIVFDDNSIDGTWEILQVASRVQDVRFERSPGPPSVHHQVRQSIAYQTAIRKYAAEFDWLAFFDSDEYLFFCHHNSVKEFLACFQEADQIAINWCIYGSNGHYLKPKVPPFEAYTRHSDEGQRVNKHVKSFVRPSRVGQNWICVHCFDVLPERNFLSNGSLVKWSKTLGIIEGDPDWSVAKIMHYQCRSMEHFVERLKKMPEFQGRPHLWEWLDQNQIEDVSPLRYSKRVQSHIRHIQRASRIQYSREDLIFDIGMGDGDLTERFLSMGFRVVGVEPDVMEFYALTERFQAAIALGNLLVLNFAATNSAEKIRLFHRHYEVSKSFLAPDKSHAEISGYHNYYVATIDWNALASRCGVPILAKINISGEEEMFIKGAATCHTLPYFLLVFCVKLETVHTLFCLGYRYFAAFDQSQMGKLWSLLEHVRTEVAIENELGSDMKKNENLSFEKDNYFSSFDSFLEEHLSNFSGRWVLCHA